MTGRRGNHELAAVFAYLAAALVALQFTRLAGNVSLIWPANALAAALLVRDGRVMRGRTAFSLWSVGTLANMAGGADHPLVAGALTGVNVFEIWFTTWVLRGYWADTAPLVDLALAGRILLLAGFCAPIIATVPGAWLVHQFFGVPLLSAATTWWQSSACGAALAAPVAYLYTRQGQQELLSPGSWRELVGLGLFSLLCTALAVRFVEHSFIVVAATLVIAALRMGALGAAVLCALNGIEMVAFWAAGTIFGATGTLPLVPMVLLLIVPVTVGVVVDDRRRAIRAQRASELWMRQLLEQSPIGMCILRLDGTWELTNAALQKMLGYPAEDLLGRLNTELFVGEEFAAGKERALQLLHGERPDYTVERRLRHRDGHWIWARCTTSLMRDPAGAPARFIVQIENLAEQRRAELELAIERDRLSTTLRAIADAVVVTDVQGKVTYLNPAAGQLLGRREEDARGRSLDDVLFVNSADDEAVRLSVVSRCLASGEVIRREAPDILHLPDGEKRYVQQSASPLHDPDGSLNGVVVVLRDVRSEFEREQRLRRDAEQDQLTGLANRRAFQERVAAVVRRCESLGSVATLLVVDLDHFKRINDQAGHPAGDEMLRQVAAALRRSTRGSDLVARLGGDEFALVLDDCGESGARRIAEDVLRNIVALRLEWNGVTCSVGASIGGAWIGGSPFMADTDTVRKWINEADAACYSAKRVGRGQIHFARTVVP